MTTLEIMKRFEEYYGEKYGAGIFFRDCRSWLEPIGDLARDFLYIETTKVFPRQYGKVPAIDVWEKILPQAYARTREELNRRRASRLIEDKEPPCPKEEAAAFLHEMMDELRRRGEE